MPRDSKPLPKSRVRKFLDGRRVTASHSWVLFQAHLGWIHGNRQSERDTKIAFSFWTFQIRKLIVFPLYIGIFYRHHLDQVGQKHKRARGGFWVYKYPGDDLSKPGSCTRNGKEKGKKGPTPVSWIQVLRTNSSNRLSLSNYEFTDFTELFRILEMATQSPR